MGTDHGKGGIQCRQRHGNIVTKAVRLTHVFATEHGARWRGEGRVGTVTFETAVMPLQACVQACTVQGAWPRELSRSDQVR